MLQNPNREPNRAGKTRRNVAGNLKRDINLLPANENSEKAARIGTIVLGIAIGCVLFALVAIMLPASKLRDRQARADAAFEQAKARAAESAQFDDRVGERNRLKSMLDTLNAYSGTEQPADLMDLISRACPDGITLLSVSLTGTGAMIDGRAPDDTAVAQFIDNLKAMQVYSLVELSGVQADDKIEGASQKRAFVIMAEYPPAEAPAQTDAQKGGDGA
jgi:Tfp pilus assembly protein PilN